MSVKEKIAEKLKTRKRVKLVSVFEESVNVRLLSIEENQSLKLEENNEQVATFLSEQFLDPESGEKIFSPEVILNELTQEESCMLLKVFLKANGNDLDKAKEFEKN